MAFRKLAQPFTNNLMDAILRNMSDAELAAVCEPKKDFMTQDITADSGTLLRQSSMTSDTYMRDAVENIDKMFGRGHAKTHPDLLIAVMQASSADFNTSFNKLAAQDIRDGLCALADAIGNHGHSIS